jgi:branched-chain amino acid transport system substrate-binding protein
VIYKAKMMIKVRQMPVRFATLGLVLTLASMFLNVPSLVTASPTPIKIGVITDRSGAYASYGEMEVNGLNLGIDYATNGTFKVLGRDIQIIVQDNVGNPSQAVSEATKLILDNGVDFLQGCADSASAIAVEAVAKTYGVIFMVAPAADSAITGEDFNNYTFRTASNTWQDAFTGGPFAAAYLGKTFAFLAPDYSWGYSTVSSWSYAIEKAGGKVIHVEYAPTSTVNFAPYLNRIISAKPDVLIPAWAGSGALYLFPAMTDLKIYDLMNVTSGIGDLFSLQLLGVAINFTGMTKYAYTLPNNTVNDWLVNTWRSRYDAGTLPVKTSLTLPVPDLFVESAFTAGQAIVYSVEHAGSTDAENLIPALEGLNFTGPKGSIYIRPEDHQALQSMYIAQVFNDTTSWIKNYYPAGFINLRLIAEIPPDMTAPPIRGDIVPPVITNVTKTPSTPAVAENVVVSAQITDDLTGVKNASLYYSTNGSSNWTESLMTPAGSSTYQATISQQPNGTLVQYYINATDKALNTAQSELYLYTVSEVTGFHLAIVVVPTEGGTTNPPVGTGSYPEGQNVTVAISAAKGFVFDYWSLDGVNVGNETAYTVTMNASHTLTAYLKQESELPITLIVGGVAAAVVIIAVAIFLIKRKK